MLETIEQVAFGAVNLLLLLIFAGLATALTMFVVEKICSLWERKE